MTVSAREFLRNFPAFRRAAEEGKEVVIATRDGTEFVFHRVGPPPRPRQATAALPTELTNRWQVESSGTGVQDWEMNR